LAREIAFGEAKGRRRFLTYIEHAREFVGESAESGAIFGFLAVLIFFIFETWKGTWPPQILTGGSISSIFTNAASQGIMAIGVTILMISGEFDLSVGSILGLSALVFIQGASSGLAGLAGMFFSSSQVASWGLSSTGFPGLLAIAVALGTGALLGLINGLLLVGTRIPSFIVTLGTLYIYRAIMLNIIPGGAIARYARGQDTWGFNPVLIILMVLALVGLSIFFFWPSLRARSKALRENNSRTKIVPLLRFVLVVAAIVVIVVVAALIIRGYAGDAQHGTLIKAKFFDILNGKFSAAKDNFRAAIAWWFVLAILFSIILNRTRYGNAVFATGGNPQAARAQGVNVNRVKVLNFVLSGTLAAVAGIMEAARFTTVEPLRGQGYELDVIAAAVIGGTLLTGGYGSIWGSMLGVLIAFMLKTGLVLISVKAEWYRGVLGIIMIAAVIINTNIRRQK
jgi:ribose/xylose/arabinose/galactoside ABC-type transport system permease subunit